MEDGVNRVAQQRLLQPARAQEGKDFGRLACQRAGDGE
jgi:hypothetical protein